jgi:hypothetical protein
MKRTRILGCLALLALSLAACKEKEAPTEPAEVAPPVSAPALPPPPPPAPPEPAPPSTEADFEEEADQQITNKNLEEELDKLERELKSP